MTNYDKDTVEKIHDIVLEHPKSFAIVLKSKANQHLLQYVLDATKKFEDLPLNTRLYWVLHEIYSYPKCKVCGLNDIPHDRVCHPIDGYRSECCSMSCSLKDPECREALKKRNLEKYGVEHANQTEEAKQKMRKSLQKRSKASLKQSIEQRKATCLAKYGVDSVSKVAEIRSKAARTILERSEEDHAQTIAKRRATNLERHGDENYVNVAALKKTLSKRTKKQLKESNDKRRSTCLERYGVDSVSKCDDIVSKMSASHKRNTHSSIYDKVLVSNDFVEPLFSKEEFVGHDHGKLKWKCKKCGEVFESAYFEHQSHIARCLKCYPLLAGSSNAEKELCEFIKHIYSRKILLNDRKTIAPQELDIVLPEVKLAFEYDGLYWHSESLESRRDYHLKKTEACEKQGLQLIHIFESEWVFKRKIVESRVKNLLGVYDKTVFARKCKIKVISPSESNSFQEANHLQGKVNCSVNIGLYDHEELVSLMSFNKSRFDKKHEWELVRFCNKLGYHVPGAAGKLLKFFERNYSPKSLVSYADRRWSQGKLYTALGFKLLHSSQPNYWYWNYKKFNGLLESRLKYQKHKQSKLLEKFDPALSECQNMTANGYMRIFDCGNLVFEWIC